jgi:uncharacterized protein YdhG (YjbR/CyaY superfamily)
MMAKRFETVEQYIASFPPDVRKKLQQVRNAIKKAAPKAEEKISYSIGAFTLNGRMLIYFAGYNNHISLYPAPRKHESFKKELSLFKGGKATLQMELNKPLPVKLISKIVRHRASEIKFKEMMKGKKK